jgi:lysophospholipase L1-like esterase
MKQSWSSPVIVLWLAMILCACASPTPTSTPRLGPTPTPTALPDAPATQPMDIAGVWLFHLRGHGGIVQTLADLSISEAGTYSIDEKTGMHIEAGTYTIHAGELVLDSPECYNTTTAVFYSCVGTYEVYCRKEGGKPVQLMLVAVDDPNNDRRVSFNNKILELDPSPVATPTPLLPAPTPAFVPTPLAGATWKYTVLGDSSSWGFPPYYGKYIEEDLGVKVQRVSWAQGGYTSAQVLQQLRDDPQVRLDVSQSQVVTFYGNPLGLIGTRIASSGTSASYDCSLQAVSAYKAELAAMADEILSLRRGQPTLIRTYTRFMPFYRLWREQGQFEEYQRCVAALDAAILQVGKERGILAADTGLALNGPNHDQDPNDKGYLYDGVHENDAGAQVVAEVFRKLGYSAIIP